MGLDVGDVGHPHPDGRIDLKLPVQGVVHEDGGLAAIAAGTALVANLRGNPGH
jgi:hypothetical protein